MGDSGLNKTSVAAVIVIVVAIGGIAAFYGLTPTSGPTTSSSRLTTMTTSTLTTSVIPTTTTTLAHSSTSTATTFSNAISTTSQVTTSVSSTSSSTKSSTSATPTSTILTTSTASISHAPGAYTVVMSDSGWNDSVPLVIHVKLGQMVSITVIYQDPNGDDHPLYVYGPANFPGPDMNGSDKVGQIQFTPTIAGTYLVECVNPNCAIHDVISGTLQIVAD